ncbi:DNA-binding GntR family transcriptional regulator [Lipingzhangella halophila]|uniref:DNA-binding GntR family transcriptional regulator n=1 Tax=Lipingzhangella halophila TaxID=1783352 RepID=A0A7W7RF99_9ACTN|nr:GntR family transcriptional regulator [Lipingzhangella halophila]MBB4930891.1 DNA-binding GntR family transcriptional regulator [Lipingzhangella halophila]
MNMPATSPLSVVREHMPERLGRGRTTEAVSEALREAILDGGLPPSTWLREDEIAAVLGVSRTPVREALRRLADEGLAVKTAHHGTVVAPMSIEDVLALYVVRENLEGLATRLAASRRLTEPLSGLDEVHTQMLRVIEREDTDSAETTKELARLNLRFHGLIRQAAANLYLDRFLSQVEQAVRRLQPSTFSAPGRPEEAYQEHAEILAAIKAGSAQDAESAAKRHMRRAREIRLSMLLGD